jgi:hypothetical protein
MGGERSIKLRNRLDLPPTIVLRCAAISVLGLLVVVALMVFARRCAGALAYPLDSPTLTMTGLLVTGAAALIRLGLLPFSDRLSTKKDAALMIVTSAAVTILLVSLCVPGTELAAMAFFCALAGIEESWAWARFLQKSHPTSTSSLRCSLPMVSSTAPESADEREACQDYPEGVSQQLTRLSSEDGVDELAGWLRATFSSGQRTDNIHVAFCPPFAATPELEVEPIDGPDARVKIAQLLPYGVRLDLKLSAPAKESISVVLQFSARSTTADA